MNKVVDEVTEKKKNQEVDKVKKQKNQEVIYILMVVSELYLLSKKLALEYNYNYGSAEDKSILEPKYGPINNNMIEIYKLFNRELENRIKKKGYKSKKIGRKRKRISKAIKKFYSGISTPENKQTRTQVIEKLIKKKNITNNNINALLSRNESNSTTNRLIQSYGLKRAFRLERGTNFTNKTREGLISPEEAKAAKAKAVAKSESESESEPKLVTAPEPKLVTAPVPPPRTKKSKAAAEKARLEKQKQSEQELRNNIYNFQNKILKEIKEEATPRPPLPPRSPKLRPTPTPRPPKPVARPRPAITKKKPVAVAENNTRLNKLASKAKNLSLANNSSLESNFNNLIKYNPYLREKGIIASELVDAFKAFKAFSKKLRKNTTQEISNNEIMKRFKNRLTSSTA
jgi:hypothetical protein